MTEEEAFKEWMARLRVIAAKYNWPIEDNEPWSDYFTDGYEPLQALLEDMSYAD